MCYSVLVKQDLEYLKREFGAIPIQNAFNSYQSLSEAFPKKFKNLEENSRIYPGYYAPILIKDKGKNYSFPMRYRIRPHDSVNEVPTKYNLFNARADSLTKRKTWQSIFMRNHGLIVFERFYEWVLDPKSGKKKVVSFSPENKSVMWAPVIYDTWVASHPSVDKTDQDKIHSFAIITKDPPQEILDNGHDRCPVFLRRNLLEAWLTPEDKKVEDMLHILQQVEETVFECSEAVP